MLAIAAVAVWLLAVTPPATAATTTYVGRIGSAATSTSASQSVVTASSTVSSGDTLIVAVMLSGQATGTVSASDAMGNTYSVERDQSDSAGNRLIVLASIGSKGLTSGGAVTVTYPAAPSSFVTVDDFKGVAGLDASASAVGKKGAFSSGSVTASSGELLYGVAGMLAKQNPSWNPGWSALATVGNSSSRLGPAWEVPSSSGSYSASGRAQGNWLAAIVAFKPDSAPVAKLSVSPTSGPVVPNGLTVTADASASTDTDPTPIASYKFDFGDDSPAVSEPSGTPSAQHTYTTGGTYTVTVTVTDTAGLSSTATATVQPDAPPAAKLTVTQTGALTVTADASASADGDSTPIASYSFNFHDGTTVGPQSSSTATHTYASAGTVTVDVTVTDTAGLSSTATSTINVTDDAPPVAKLTVTPSSGAVGVTVTADASASTDTDSTPIASYQFDFGDGTGVVSQTNSKATHTYNSAGGFIVTVTVIDTAGMSSTTSATVTVTGQIAVYAGYYDTHHANTNPKPSPWMGSPGVVFQGTPDSSSGGWDTSAVRIDNITGLSLSSVSVTVSIGTKTFALWNATPLSSGQTLILAQTAYENFDGSDENPAGCYSCDATLCTTEVQSTVPVVHVTVAGTTTNYPDPQQVLNTHGVDSAGCPYTGTRNDESTNWQQLYSGP